ncbi:hypothetical protein [Defluviimonas sp. SAOS-178_SWC]|uniref:hypothetical protein n=1 Tax=Defluviimonas sp. SAOS-178_SWC TaxID=3121287 RepID=UPI00322177C4
MGEFSAGKSTLANLLMNDDYSPVQVTATQMPPVWYAQGDGPALRIAMDGSEEPLDSDEAGAISVRNTRAIRKFVAAEILEACDIIDMPGSSDPNITEDIWQRMLPLADAVIWCTPATQAWRQSEAALWEEAPGRLFPRSLLLITRIDKVLSEADQRRLIGRVQREAGPMFREVIPVSLIEAQDAVDDPDAWRSSGVEAVLAGLGEIIAEVERGLALEPQTDPSDLFAANPVEPDEVGAEAPMQIHPAPVEPAPVAPAPDDADTVASAPDAAAAMPEAAEEAPTVRVVPRRVVARTGGQAQSQRPRRAATGSLI